MLYGFLVTLFVLTCFLLILLVYIQKGKSSMGLGGMGGGNQLLFGGSGGQDMFQKATWVLGAVFMFGSLGLALLKQQQFKTSKYLQQSRHLVPQERPAVPQPSQQG